MPTIEVSKKHFEELYGRPLGERELDDLLQKVKGELEGYNAQTLKIELQDTNRPDTWSSEGIIRILKQIGNKPINNKYTKTIKIKGLSKIRPYAASFIAKRVKLTDELLTELIQLQEKISENYGGKRKRVACGIYNNKKITWPITFSAQNIDEARMQPLGFDHEMTLRTVLKKHPKGIQYAHLLENQTQYPVYKDKRGIIISMPPITNNDSSGRVSVEDTELFIEVSGTDIDQVLIACNIFAYNLADRGAKIEPIAMEYEKPTKYGKKIITPYNFKQKMMITANEVEKMYGEKLSEKEIIKHLKNMQYQAKLIGKKIFVEIPPYRRDIFSEVDIIEDIIISIGYNNIIPKKIELFTIGNRSKLMKKNHLIRDLMIRLGFLEINNPLLTNKEELFEKTNRPRIEIIEIKNVVSKTYSALKHVLLPGLLSFEKKNTHIEYPHKIFEAGDVVEFNPKKDTLSEDKQNLAIMISSSQTDFNEIKSVLTTIFEELNITINLKESEDKLFTKGRRADVFVKNKKIGVFGEINPEVIIKNNIEMPMTGIEINVNELEI